MLKKFKSMVVNEGLFKSEDRLEFRANQVFRDISLRNKSLLEIGCGNGVYSIWARLKGAELVIGLEPGVDGSTLGSSEKFSKFTNALHLDNIECLHQTIQEFDSKNKKFDIVLSNSSVNHLDEDACMRLNRDLNAQERYLKIFRKVKTLMNPEGKFIILDNSSKNFFGLFKKRSPFAPEIDWKKHQIPQVWIRLLEKAGFGKPRLSWVARYKYFPALLSRKRIAYFFNSFFRLEISVP